MLSKTMRVGDAIEIGDVVAIRMEYKTGSCTKFSIFTELPIRDLINGIIPPRYTHGITAPRRVLEDFRSVA